ncbi:MAG: hypothetical protein KAS16_00310, partial [Thermoplasmata archaeon]|nr:hypothetical protein [Thermoplasmata archaeon]
EVTDKAGNVVELRHTVEYAPETGTNNAAIGMMIALLIIGLVAGFFIAMMIWKETPEEVEPTSEIIDEDAEKPEGEDIESIDEEVSEGDIPLDDEETEIMSDEEMSSEEIGDAIIDEEVPEGEFETPDEEFGDDMGEDMPEGEMDDLSETPDEDPEDIGAAIVDEEFPEEEMPDEIELEDEIIEAEPEELEADEPAVSEEVDESLEEDIPEIDEDPRISKLRQALEDGKISQELFDKNIARIKSD